MPAHAVLKEALIRSFEVPVDEETKVTYIVMEYVRGEVLKDCWDDMSEARRERVCDQAASAIAELQSLHVDRPGPIGGGRSRGTWFTTLGAGPFHSVRELEDWFTHKLDVCKRYNRAYASIPPFMGKFGKMVMSHMDVAPRNIILEGDNNICLIDWDFAGAYPVHFERAGLLNQVREADFCKRMLARMKPYEQEINDLESVTWAITSAYLI
ncbi:unnamed protein product [Chondrus crispus]|uniref:Aminoglycoside phosphotransferase domain-containing protein n=1 Tax=Chondrus crispus TaxID=2769 RepID=R7Q6C0_CHOCR|nr:unnamed protein product [Chondrus crispus]CDF33393.1 unnamed protein product [Chondrus crispus]|eukprot:XP_005713196.1 unnamed protein product [Chondrus crispus]